MIKSEKVLASSYYKNFRIIIYPYDTLILYFVNHNLKEGPLFRGGTQFEQTVDTIVSSYSFLLIII